MSIPKLSDLFNNNNSTPPVDLLQIFTYMWVWFLGGWFFAGVIGVIAGSLYMKYDNAMVPSVFLILMILLLNGVFFAQPDNGLPSAEGFVYISGILVSIVVGLVIYGLFIKDD